MSLVRAQQGKRPRRESSDELYVEELSPDDMGYDGDVEVLRPDYYEEVDSDFEDDKTTKQQPWPDTEEELARKLRQLACDPDSNSPPRGDNYERGHKRRSKEMETEGQSGRRTEIEVSELLDGQPEQRPTKRRKKKPSQQSMAHRLGRKHAIGTWSDSSDTGRTDERDIAAIESSCSATPEVTPAPGAVDGDDDAMDIG